MAKSPVTVLKTNNSGGFLKRLKAIGTLATYVGIPSDSPVERAKQLAFKASLKTKTIRRTRAAKLLKRNTIGNAHALYIFSKGSQLRAQPPRPVIEPALLAPGNKERISAKIAESSLAFAKGQNYISKQLLASAGAMGAKASRDWFTDSRNNWAPNSASTIAHKGFDSPGIDTGTMVSAITHIEKEI